MPKVQSSQLRPPFDPKALGNFIKSVRESKDLSLGDIARMADTAKQAVANLEQGTVVSSIRTIEAVCVALGLDVLEALKIGFGCAEAKRVAAVAEILELLEMMPEDRLSLVVSQTRTLLSWKQPSKPSPRKKKAKEP
jgi:transcriptional regulator with XRE-family HTH domain